MRGARERVRDLADHSEWVSPDGDLLKGDCQDYCENSSEVVSCRFERVGTIEELGVGGRLDHFYEDNEQTGAAGASGEGGPGVVYVTCVDYDPGVDCY